MTLHMHLTRIMMVLACLESACDEDVSLGRAAKDPPPPSLVGPPDSGFMEDAAPRNPCEGKVCGDRCVLPDTGIQMEMFCDPEGVCREGLSLACGG